MIRLISLPDIELETNSVFIPETVQEVFRSAKFLVESGIKNCQLSYSIGDPWDSVHLAQMREEIKELRKYLLSYYQRHRSIPVKNFQSRLSPGLFQCAAGQDRLALGPDGKLWGCRFFADLFAAKVAHPELNAYCFGDIRDFAKDSDAIYSAVIQKYKELHLENFFSEGRACRDCPDLFLCSPCPATAAFSSGVIGKIPAWVCKMKRIWRDEVAKFWAEAEPS
jgi:radical SAM protein with 4Fe4S-binding SPASM domain